MQSALSIFVVCFRWILSTSRMLTISQGEGIPVYTGYQLNIIYGDFLKTDVFYFAFELDFKNKNQ